MPRPDDFTPALPSARHLPTELLCRYVAGELSAAQEHAVEAHTLECEQCAEVLEGLEMQPAPVTDASLAELRQRLHARVAELATENTPAPPVVPVWWRPLAAAAVLLLMLGAVAWLVLRPVAQPELAARTVPAASKVRPADNPVADLDGAGATAERPGAAASSSDLSGTVAAAPRQQPVKPAYPAPLLRSSSGAEGARLIAAEVAADEVPETPAAAAPAVAATTAEVVAASGNSAATAKAAAPAADYASNSRRTAEPGETARALRAVAPAAALRTPNVGRTVQGRIVDLTGQPVPGALITIAGEPNGVSTDLEGYFSRKTGTGTSLLYISAAGYKSQVHTLQPSDSTLTLALAPDTKHLSEAAMVRREAPPGLPSLGPLPTGGYPAFQQYLRDSLDYPAVARDKRLEGYVRLQFVVGVDGKLTDIRVVSKLSPECDEEAIRLLKEGPAWFSGVQNNRRTARKVELKVPFFLENR
ncbi:TonB family protein [Hymenobacter psychrophilus]|uniref:TonB family C-terminal domain-containing protein n=1 Tax=Hymenobacter psychrophilus TaxID=651662 RepID=A0A1H3JDC0_9BACT|nr:TonB family protein [Hymenobacter psychrophilus]SDY37579.1 TonB family C-terminal domain-containing protein [Hymenobacter psychrophilus]